MRGELRKKILVKFLDAYPPPPGSGLPDPNVKECDVGVYRLPDPGQFEDAKWNHEGGFQFLVRAARAGDEHSRFEGRFPYTIEGIEAAIACYKRLQKEPECERAEIRAAERGRIALWKARKCD